MFIHLLGTVSSFVLTMLCLIFTVGFFFLVVDIDTSPKDAGKALKAMAASVALGVLSFTTYLYLVSR